jgi:transcriptional regulator with XRE-family HTH domain
MARAFAKIVTRQDRDRLAQLLRQSRIEAGLAQQDLAERLGVPVSVLSKMETGHRGVEVLELWAICRVMGLNFAALSARVEELLAEPA